MGVEIKEHFSSLLQGGQFIQMRDQLDYTIMNTLRDMQLRLESEASVTLKIDIAASGVLPSKIRPTFTYKITAAITHKSVTEGAVKAEGALVWDDAEASFTFIRDEDPQTSLFDVDEAV